MNTLEAISTWGVSDRYLMYAGRLMSPMQRCFSDLVCQPSVTSYVIDIYLCLAVLHAWTMEYQHMMLRVWCWIPTEAERQWPAREDRWVALRRMPTLDYYLCCGDLRLPGSWSGSTIHSDYAKMMMMKDVNADDNEISFSAKKTKTNIKVTCAYITELNYVSVANITFSAQSKWHFWNENEK